MSDEANEVTQAEEHGAILASQDDASECPLFRAANEPRLF